MTKQTCIPKRALLVLALTLMSSGAWACRPGVDPHCPATPRPQHHLHHVRSQEAAGSVGSQAPSDPLTPMRAYLARADIPPADVGGYGMVVLSYKATDANRAKLLKVCKDFVSFFPKSNGSDVAVEDQMITIWPVDTAFVEEAEKDDCDFSLLHYDLVASEQAMADARKQGANLDGEGPFLIGWAPSDTRGVPGKLVLTVDLSRVSTQAEIDRDFKFWKDKIVEDPSLWRGGFSMERLRTAIADFADHYGQDILDGIKLSSASGGG